jgi:hypothetical protein
MYHTTADIGRLYAKTEKGRRGLLLIKVTCKEDIISIAEHLTQNMRKTSL